MLLNDSEEVMFDLIKIDINVLMEVIMFKIDLMINMGEIMLYDFIECW